MKNFFSLTYLALVFLRLSSVVFITRFPLFTWLFIYVLDVIDYYPALRSGITFKQYEWIDKTLDLITRIYLVYSFYLLNLPYLLLLLMFLYRLIGDILLAVTQKRIYLFLFPNLIEYFYPLYFIYLTYKLPIIYLYLFILISFVLKIFHEYQLHVRDWIDPVNKAYIQKHPRHKRKVSK